jgi:hypothetical protein
MVRRDILLPFLMADVIRKSTSPPGNFTRSFNWRLCEIGTLTECPFMTNRVTLTVCRPLSDYPDQQTFLWFVGMSQTCHNPTLSEMATASAVAIRQRGQAMTGLFSPGP